jgi:hypothetical protein
MKGDFTRNTFRNSKHYRKVNMQQGRVQVDADWNEQNDIQFHYEKEYLKDLIGKNGTLAKNDGFAITPSGNEFLIGRGSYYVDGILCENESTIEYSKQSEVVLPSKFAARPYLVYLDVWERHITHLDDPYIREQALGNVDTATRSKIVWQVLTIDASDLGTDKCKIWQNALKHIDQPTTGTLEARAKPSPKSTDKCSLYETAGYTRLENQLYRVEVHNGGDLGAATFKWSRENGAVVSKITKFESGDNRLVIEKRGKDELLDFKKDDWVEITDDLNELHGIPGTLVQLDLVEDTTITYDPATIRPGDKPLNDASYPLSRNPKMRRWEPARYETPAGSTYKPLIDSTINKDSDGYIELEDGVQVRVGNGNYRSGDHWVIAARAREGKVEWPTDSNGKPIAQGPAGIFHHYAPLAMLKYKNEKFEPEADLRSFFSSLTDLIAIHYAGGDNQQALPDNKLPFPLRVAVTLGRQPISKTPMRGSKVRFTIIQQLSSSPGWLRPLLPADSALSQQPIDVSINAEGIAECEWTLGDGMEVQQIKAELYDECDKLADLPPIYFGASLPILFYYISGDGIEVPKGGTITTLLQVGIKIGRTPVVSGYEVRFNKTSGTLSLSSVVPTNGVASSTWNLTSTDKPEQAWAELYYQSGNAGAAKPANVAPIYFSATVEDPRSSSAAATTGLLKLEIPEGANPPPLVYGPFSHELPGLRVPPAVILGLSINDTSVKYTEDYVLASPRDRKEVHFKPVLITPATFMVHLWDSTQGRRGIVLRWWAVPADHKGTKDGVPINVEFVPRDVPFGNKTRVIVRHTNTPDEAIRVKITVDLLKGPIIKLRRRRTDAGAEYISEEFIVRDTGIQFGEQQILPVPGLRFTDMNLFAIYLDERDNEIASGSAHVFPIVT